MASQQAFFLWHTCHGVSYKTFTYYTCSCCTVGPGGPGAMAKCRPLRCPEFRTKATWVAASAAASCSKYKNSKKIT